MNGKTCFGVASFCRPNQCNYEIIHMVRIQQTEVQHFKKTIIEHFLRYSLVAVATESWGSMVDILSASVVRNRNISTIEKSPRPWQVFLDGSVHGSASPKIVLKREDEIATGIYGRTSQIFSPSFVMS